MLTPTGSEGHPFIRSQISRGFWSTKNFLSVRIREITTIKTCHCRLPFFASLIHFYLWNTGLESTFDIDRFDVINDAIISSLL